MIQYFLPGVSCEAWVQGSSVMFMRAYFVFYLYSFFLTRPGRCYLIQPPPLDREAQMHQWKPRMIKLRFCMWCEQTNFNSCVELVCCTALCLSVFSLPSLLSSDLTSWPLGIVGMFVNKRLIPKWGCVHCRWASRWVWSAYRSVSCCLSDWFLVFPAN